MKTLEKWETGVLNIDDCRIEYDPNDTNIATNPSLRKTINGGNGGKVIATETERRVVLPNSIGRFPANVIMDEEAMEILDEQSGTLKSGFMKAGHPYGQGNGQNVYGKLTGTTQIDTYGDSGGASRFFYCAKAHKSEKGEFNNHPTVKPIKLMEYLVRLVTPENGVVLDPFSGSGSTIIASINMQKNYIGFELNQEYVDIINKRIHNNK